MELRPDPQAVAGSPLWQAAFISFGIVLILFEVVRGWRLGLLRQLLRIVALATAYGAAIVGGRFLVPIARPFLKMPDFVVSILAGAVLALVIYAAVIGIGMVLFKRTNQQSSQRVHLISGFAGAIVGLVFGLFVLWLIMVGVRGVGAVADAQVRGRASSPEPGQSASARGPAVRQPNAGPTAFATSLARLKNSLELGPFENAVRETDPVPLKTYETLRQVGAVFSSPDRARKFFTFPGAHELSEHPKIVALRNDPEISEMIAHGRFFDLLRNQRIIDAANDPTLADRIKKFDLQQALDYALSKSNHE
jgi:membrane protein required for colicin V production